MRRKSSRRSKTNWRRSKRPVVAGLGHRREERWSDPPARPQVCRVARPSRKGGRVAKRQDAAPCGDKSRMTFHFRERLPGRSIFELGREWRHFLSLRDPAGAPHAAGPPGRPAPNIGFTRRRRGRARRPGDRRRARTACGGFAGCLPSQRRRPPRRRPSCAASRSAALRRSCGRRHG